MMLKEKLLKSIAQSHEMDEEEFEVLAYGMEILLQKIFFFIGAIIISVIMGALVEGIVFMLLFAILRQNAGGIHMKSKIACAISSAGIFVVALILINLATRYAVVYNVLLCLSGVGIIILLALAPVDTPNKRMMEEQKKKNSLKVKFVLLVLYLFLFAFTFLGLKQICSVIVVIVVVEAILVAVGKILLNSSSIW